MTKDFDREPMLKMFILTVKSSLEQLEQAVSANVRTNMEPADVKSIIKIMQTIKGSSEMMMYTNVSSLAQSAEDLFSFMFDNQSIEIDLDKLAEIVLKVSDFIKNEVNKLENKQPADGDSQSLITVIEQLMTSSEVNAAKKTPEALQAYQADIYFEDDCGMENVRAFSVLHNIEQIAQEITHTPDDIDSSESSEIIQQQGFHLCFKSQQSVKALHELFEKTPFLKEFHLCEPIKELTAKNPVPEQNAECEKIQSAVGGKKPDKGVERMAELEDIRHEDTQKGKFLTFSVGNEYYGIEIRYVTEIIGGIQAITEVPELPEYVKGIINLRGTIIPVMDIRLRFKKEPKAYTDRTCIVVVNIKDILIGLIVDAVSEVITIAEQDIVAPPNGHKSFQNRYIKGIGKVGSEVKLLLDCNKLINDEEFESLTNIQ